MNFVNELPHKLPNNLIRVRIWESLEILAKSQNLLEREPSAQSPFHSFHFNLFKYDIGTRHQFECSRFSIGAQWMYCCTTRDVHCYLWLQGKIHWKMSVQQVWCFMHRILQVQQRRMLYLNLRIDQVGHCIRYANIKFFVEANFTVYGQNPRTYTGKYV